MLFHDQFLHKNMSINSLNSCILRQTHMANFQPQAEPVGLAKKRKVVALRGSMEGKGWVASLDSLDVHHQSTMNNNNNILYDDNNNKHII